MSFQSTSLSRGKTDISQRSKKNGFFQSTSLSRGKTILCHNDSPFHVPFNPLPSHEGRLFLRPASHSDIYFQSTSLSRGKTLPVFFYYYLFYLSIHFPLTREDGAFEDKVKIMNLSIHFPLTREDLKDGELCEVAESFNPLPSHEGRRSLSTSSTRQSTFQSTSLSRVKTRCSAEICLPSSLSIHFPLTREDRICLNYALHREPFNPLPSHEGRRGSA